MRTTRVTGFPKGEGGEWDPRCVQPVLLFLSLLASCVYAYSAGLDSSHTGASALVGMPIGYTFELENRKQSAALGHDVKWWSNAHYQAAACHLGQARHTASA